MLQNIRRKGIGTAGRSRRAPSRQDFRHEPLCRSDLPMKSKDPTSAEDSIPAARYLRMSTEHQQYSMDNQSEAIKLYAQEHNMEIVRTYSDAGKSGLTLEHRPGLRELLQDV